MKFKIIVCMLSALVITFVFMMWSYTVLDGIYFSHSEAINKTPGILYVLQWTSPNTEPFVYMKREQETFMQRNCYKQNCYITSNRNLLNNVKLFDVVLFHGHEILQKTIRFPEERSANQIYIFTSMESSAYYSVPDGRFNGIFNFTWTYKLSSDIFYGYIIVRNRFGEVMGPRANMKWISIDKMRPINGNIKAKLENKTIAAAWFVSNCKTPNQRLELAQKVMKELKKYNMVVDVYGKCGTKNCYRESMTECLQMLQRDYYFYFAFENSMADDYVTEKLLHALQNYAVPVVFGGANYKRFMPDGIYLNAGELSVEELVNQMVGSIRDKKIYYNFFKWHNHYTYENPEQSTDTDPYCQFCDYINNIVYKDQRSTVYNFKEWWNPR